MELPGELYLFNLSILAITFSAVSALIALLRQAMVGKLSSFDVFLVNAYVSHGFVVAINSVLPSLMAQSGLPLPWVWSVASGIATVFLSADVANTMRQRRKATNASMPFATLASFCLHWFGVLLLIANALIPSVQGVFLFGAALTICLATVMWAFVRRIASLMDDKPPEDWDSKQLKGKRPAIKRR
jgi:hypothetical protein